MGRIYTRTGDNGQTALFGGPRVRKDHARLEALGAIDELNSAVGMARSWPLPADVDTVLHRIQHELFVVGAELAHLKAAKSPAPAVGPEQVRAIEAEIDRFDAQLPELRSFVIPGGIGGAAALYLARAVCRRAERCVVAALAETAQQTNLGVLPYLNRLGDLLFVVARYVNYQAGADETLWNA